jgi:chemotaxis protein histidine kinase CheA
MSDKKSAIIDDYELMEAFYQEAQDLIAEMRGDLSIVGEERTPPIFRRLFRCAHTIKSSARSVGFNELSEMTQALEQVFKAAEEGRCGIDDDDAVSLFSSSVEACQKLLDGKESMDHKDHSELLGRLNTILHDRGEK